jgi:V-type H+-transporting ATPase subunit A
MLGLRPRLKARPSLLDLVRRNNIDQISQEPSRTAPLEADERPKLIPLPSSPLITPLREPTSPPLHTLAEEPKEELKEEAKMPPVSLRIEMGDYRVRNG